MREHLREVVRRDEPGYEIAGRRRDSRGQEADRGPIGERVRNGPDRVLGIESHADLAPDRRDVDRDGVAIVRPVVVANFRGEIGIGRRTLRLGVARICSRTELSWS